MVAEVAAAVAAAEDAAAGIEGGIGRVDIFVHLPMRGEGVCAQLFSLTIHRPGGQKCPPSLLLRPPVSGANFTRVALAGNPAKTLSLCEISTR